MPKEPQCRSRLWRTSLLLFAVILVGFGYRMGYYRTTALRIDTPQLDWYAYREFSSRAHFIFFFPMFYLESHYDRSNPGYVLQPSYGRKRES
jgi:hypothetical protein